MLARAAERIRAFGPWPEGRPVLLACSGGADSTFLAHAWRQAASNLSDSEEFGFPQALVVVVDHDHRSGSDSDALQAQGLYSALGFPVRICQAGAPAGAHEARLREHRYHALRAIAEEVRASAILFAHHADDQAETVLLRILRGTGLTGLSGIPQRRSLTHDLEIQRPLLDFRSHEIRAALTEMGQPWIEDPSNADPQAAARNHLRHRAMPALEPLASAEPATALLRLAAEAEEWKDALDQILDSYEDWSQLPSYLRRCALRPHLQAVGATISPARLRDLEGSLLRRGQAMIDAHHGLKWKGGRLLAEPTSEGEMQQG